ncbi:MAG: serine/threonine protein kinase [Acidobacteria bacterium]|nr:serine/threonine protein kinase [Acidobacteriota bacterium]
MTASAPAPIGVVAHYNLLERLEPAGPGELFRARDTRLGRTVAVRILPHEFARDADARVSLIEQARALVALSHPNVTTLFDVGEHDGRVYLIFEFLKGQSLRAEMACRQMKVRRAIELAIQIADAVADAHAAGFVHGGLSPDSIAITSKGHAKIPAFELAARSGFDRSAADVRLRDYESPEEARGQPADERSDIYSVGAVLFEMLTTRRPPHRGTAAPSASNRNVPSEVDAIVLKAVAPNAALRFQSVATLAAELRSAAAILDVRGGAGDEHGRPEEQATSVGRVLILTAVILLALGGLAWWMAAQ